MWVSTRLDFSSYFSSPDFFFFCPTSLLVSWSTFATRALKTNERSKEAAVVGFGFGQNSVKPRFKNDCCGLDHLKFQAWIKPFGISGKSTEILSSDNIKNWIIKPRFSAAEVAFRLCDLCDLVYYSLSHCTPSQ